MFFCLTRVPQRQISGRWFCEQSKFLQNANNSTSKERLKNTAVGCEIQAYGLATENDLSLTKTKILQFFKKKSV